MKKVQPLHKYCPIAIGTAFRTSFLLGAKFQTSGFGKISNLGFRYNLVVLNARTNKSFEMRNFTEKCRIQGVYTE